MQLKLLLPGLNLSCSVALAAVRWTHGLRCGVEFIKMTEKDQRQLAKAMARYPSNRAVPRKGLRQQFSDPLAQNWHLDAHSLAEKGV